MQPPDQPTSADLVGAYVAEQVAVIVGRRDDVRDNGPDAVHATRVACRRLRSTLRTFRPLWAADQRAIIKDLRWYGWKLGAARDTEVVEEALLDLIDDVDLPSTLPLETRLRQRLDADRARSFAVLHKTMDGKRFRRFTAALQALVDAPGWHTLADVPGSRLLPALAYGPVTQVLTMVAELPDGGEEREFALHEVRKKAKAARYAYEAMGKGHERAAKAWKNVTETLGSVQDGVTMEALLDQLRPAAAKAGEPTEPYDAIAARLEEAAALGGGDGLAAVEAAVQVSP